MLKHGFNKTLSMFSILGLYIACSSNVSAQGLFASSFSIHNLEDSLLGSFSANLAVNNQEKTSLFLNSSPILMSVSDKTHDNNLLSDLSVVSVLPTEEKELENQDTEEPVEILKGLGQIEVYEMARKKEEVESLPPTPTPTVMTEEVKTERIEIDKGGLDAEKLFEMSNKYRVSKGLAPFEKDSRTCELAISRAPEIYNEIYGGVMHSGLRARNLNYWNMENIISMNSEEKAFNWWIEDLIHRVQLEADNKYSCVACSGNSCVQEFTNFLAK